MQGCNFLFFSLSPWLIKIKNILKVEFFNSELEIYRFNRNSAFCIVFCCFVTQKSSLFFSDDIYFGVSKPCIVKAVHFISHLINIRVNIRLIIPGCLIMTQHGLLWLSKQILLVFSVKFSVNHRDSISPFLHSFYSLTSSYAFCGMADDEQAQKTKVK